MQPIKILLIEDDPEFARQIREMIRQADGATFSVELVARFEDGLARIKTGGADLVLLDLSLPDGAGLTNVQLAQAECPHVPVIVLGNSDEEAVAVEAVHEGAQDYLVKGQLNPQHLSRTIRYAIERERAEAALAAAEEKYRSIFEHIVEGIFQTSPDGRFLNANAALARIYGYSSPEELMTTVTDIGRKLYVEEGRREKFIRLMQEHDVVTDFESPIYRKDGSVIWITENVRAIRGAGGKLLYYEGTVQDITQRKQAEENLRNSEALYHSLVENLPQNIFRKDLQERFTFANQQFCRTLGKRLDEIIGKTDFDFFPAELARKYQEDDRRVVETGKLIETVEENQPPDGKKIYVQVVKTPLYDAQGRIIGTQCIFWDITERKQAEEKIQQANAELARSQEALRLKNEQMEANLKVAREIQLNMLPQQYPTFPSTAKPSASALRFCHRYHPTGDVGGDFFNVLALSDTEAGVFICDVMGHGPSSALVTAMIRALVEDVKPEAWMPGKMLSKLNHDLCAILKNTGSPMLTTAFYLVADLTKGEIRYANAGHPKPLLVQRERGNVAPIEQSEGKCGPALGLFDQSIYSTSQCALSPGDLVMLFTDGLYEVEGADHELYNLPMLTAAVRKRLKLPAADIFDELLAEIRQFALGQNFNDDVCLVGMEVADRKPAGR